MDQRNNPPTNYLDLIKGGANRDLSRGNSQSRGSGLPNPQQIVPDRQSAQGGSIISSRQDQKSGGIPGQFLRNNESRRDVSRETSQDRVSARNAGNGSIGTGSVPFQNAWGEPRGASQDFVNRGEKSKNSSWEVVHNDTNQGSKGFGLNEGRKSPSRREAETEGFYRNQKSKDAQQNDPFDAFRQRSPRSKGFDGEAERQNISRPKSPSRPFQPMVQSTISNSLIIDEDEARYRGSKVSGRESQRPSSPVRSRLPSSMNPSSEPPMQTARESQQLSPRHSQTIDPALKSGLYRYSTYYEERKTNDKRQTGPKSIQEKFTNSSREEFMQQISKMEQKKEGFIKISFLILFCFLVYTFYFCYGLHTSKKPFCDSGLPTGSIPDQACRLCPTDGECKGGKLKNCPAFMKIVDDRCVTQDADTQLVKKVYNEAVKIVADLKGNLECTGVGESSMITWDLRNELLKRFSDFEDAYNATWTVIGMAREEGNGDFLYDSVANKLAAVSPRFTLSCYCKIFIRKNPVALIIFLIGFFLSLIMIVRVSRELEKKKNGSKYYEYIEELLISSPNHQMFEEEIKRSLRMKFKKSKSEIDEIFGYVMSAGIKSEKIEFAKKIENGIDQRVWWMDL